MSHLNPIIQEIERCYPEYFSEEQKKAIVQLCEDCHWLIGVHQVVRAIQSEAKKRLPNHIENII